MKQTYNTIDVNTLFTIQFTRKAEQNKTLFLNIISNDNETSSEHCLNDTRLQ